MDRLRCKVLILSCYFFAFSSFSLAAFLPVLFQYTSDKQIFMVKSANWKESIRKDHGMEGASTKQQLKKKKKPPIEKGTPAMKKERRYESALNE